MFTGPFPATLFSARLSEGGEVKSTNKIESAWRFHLAPLPRKSLSPIGAGDAVAGGTILHWNGDVPTTSLGSIAAFRGTVNCNENDESLINAFAWGISCGAASCMTSTNSVFELADVQSIRKSLDIHVVDLSS